MSARVQMVDGPLPPAAPVGHAVGAGAAVAFEGIVREREAGVTIAALVYTTYDPMAERQLALLAADMVRKHGLLTLHAEHSRGRVAVGECSFRLTIHAPHRKEALAAMDEFIDRLKRDVPIWKSAVP
ncbi:MAG: molybdenum cofactor biosynthesis protein MoaE [Phycisphaerales bacterium]|nr:molybdenum cofactor biosynthesis protein MoaE [Phycisphaerales bacterium]